LVVGVKVDIFQDWEREVMVMVVVVVRFLYIPPSAPSLACTNLFANLRDNLDGKA
jgi:hypothetical protein